MPRKITVGLVVSAAIIVTLWMTASFRVSAELKVASPIEDITFSPDGNFLGVATHAGVQVWQITNHQHQLLVSIKDAYGPIAWSPGGHYIATAMVNHTIGVWQVNTGKLYARFEGHTAAIRDLAFSPDGTLVASASLDGSIRVWSIQERKLVHILSDQAEYFYTVAFQPDGQVIASSGSDFIIRLWNMHNGIRLRAIQADSSVTNSIAFSPDGETIAAGGQAFAVTLWRVQDGHELRAFEGHTDYVNSVAFSPDGTLLASGAGGYETPGAGTDTTVRLWRVHDGQLLKVYTGHRRLLSVNIVTSVAFSPDGQLLAAGRSDGTVQLWQVK